MFHFEKRIVQGLKRVSRRSRPAHSSLSKVDGKVDGAVRIRESRFSDFASVSALKVRHNLKPDLLANWQRLWKDNPAIDDSRQFSMGWVLEGDSGVVGYLGSIPLRCFYQGTALNVTATHGLAVEAGYRAYTGGLVSRYVRQKAVDLLLSTSAGEVSRKMFEAFKGQLLPQPYYSTALFWVIDVPGFLAAVQEKLQINGLPATVGKFVAAPLLRAEQILRRRSPRRRAHRCEISEIPPSAIGDDFEELWRKKRATSRQLIADRSAEVLRWHFDIADDQRRTTVLRCQESGRLRGYAIVVTRREGRLRKAWIADILVDDEDSSVARELLIAAFEYARRTRHHVFEIIGCPLSIRRICREWNPYSRQHSSYLFKAATPLLNLSLSSEDAWYATMYDGDTTLMPEYDFDSGPMAATSLLPAMTRERSGVQVNRQLH